jgi:predicted RNA-binding Zn-ribbon protein involved in translation (DUF1610 family)
VAFPYLVIAVPIAIVVVILLVPVLIARGKRLKCPDCGEEFSAPVMDQRYGGVGWSPPYMGRVKCPKCGQVRARRDYITVKR